MDFHSTKDLEHLGYFDSKPHPELEDELPVEGRARMDTCPLHEVYVGWCSCSGKGYKE